LRKLGNPYLSVVELNDFISSERLKKRFDLLNLASEDKKKIIKTYEYVLSNGSWFGEIKSIAVDLTMRANYFEDEVTFMAAVIILGLAITQRENIQSRINSDEAESNDAFWLNKMAKILETLED